MIPILSLLYPKYENRFLKIGADIFPVVAFPIENNQSDDPNSVLGSLDQEKRIPIDPQLKAAGNEYLNHLEYLKKSEGRPLVNLPTFCYDRFAQDGQMKIDCSMGNYFDNLKSCFVLEWELTTQLGMWETPSEGYDRFVRQLILRNRVTNLASDRDPVLDPVGRRPAIGVQTMTLFNQGDHYAVLFGERSSKGVIAEEDYLALIPQGVFQPTANDPDHEFSVIHNVLREYYEELFAKGKEVEGPPSAMSYDYFYKKSDVKYLRGLIEAGSARIYLTGVAMNMLNLRLDICTMLVIDTDEWYEKHSGGEGSLSRIKFNEEWKDEGEKKTRGPNVWTIDRLEKHGLSPATTFPTSAAAIALGLGKARQKGLLHGR